jgi:hypothetical protein
MSSTLYGSSRPFSCSEILGYGGYPGGPSVVLCSVVARPRRPGTKQEPSEWLTEQHVASERTNDDASEHGTTGEINRTRLATDSSTDRACISHASGVLDACVVITSVHYIQELNWREEYMIRRRARVTSWRPVKPPAMHKAINLYKARHVIAGRTCD